MAISFAVAYMLVSDTLVQVLIRERENKIKHQIILSGSSKIAYWLSNYIVDVFLHSIPAVTALWTI